MKQTMKLDNKVYKCNPITFNLLKKLILQLICNKNRNIMKFFANFAMKIRHFFDDFLSGDNNFLSRFFFRA